MSVRERMILIRLMEKLDKHPAYAMLLGIEVTGAFRDQNEKNNPKGLTNS